MNANVKKWEGTLLLEGLKEPYLSLTADILEAQRLQNERYNDRGDEMARFKRVSIPMVRRVIPYLKCMECAQLEPIFESYTKPKHQLASIFVSKKDYMKLTDEGEWRHCLDKEAEKLAEACVEIRDKIDKIVQHLVGYLPDGVKKPVVGITPFSLNGDTVEIGIELR
ncbi:hypothetical protein DRO91_07120 [Candidatus Heimdallarchaeota archaeon]|nr:MAG: hypothetical protein DRO91_07120 [Candidatus Heimdallarchaeota archaeon]